MENSLAKRKVSTDESKRPSWELPFLVVVVEDTMSDTKRVENENKNNLSKMMSKVREEWSLRVAEKAKVIVVPSFSFSKKEEKF